MYLSIAVTQTSSQCADTITIDKAVSDQPHCTADNIRSAVPLG